MELAINTDYKMLRLFAIFLAILSIADAIGSNVTVSKLGIAVGKLEKSKWSGKEFYSFRGIPFAQPPIGNLRYAPPVKVDAWDDGYVNATYFRNICPQTKQPGYDVESYDEDCLHLNVYVPAASDASETQQSLPVMIWIHGGDFMSGYAPRFEPYYLMESDVILVVPQFRLGPLGLLCLETDDMPGNMQFLDQIMAMQWVQENIESFNGDKNKVTLFGQSSGSFGVNLHILSPLSRGLFHQTILQSGSVYMTGMVDKNAVQTTKEIATELGCNVESKETILECMKNLTAKTILQGFDKYIAGKSASGRGAWGGNRAVIQRSGSIRFLPDDPSTLIDTQEFAKLPMMGGTTSQDGSLATSGLYDALSTTGLLENPDFLKDNLIPLLLEYLVIPDETGGIAQLLIDRYFPNGELGDFLRMVPGITDMSSVLLFKAGIYRMLRNNLLFQPSYLYSFDYRGNQTRFGYESGIKYPFDGGVAHSDDIIYLFPFPDKLTEDDTIVAKRMVQLWTSFAIKGAPSANDTERWPMMSTRNGPYLKIGFETSIGENYLDEYDVTVRGAAGSSVAGKSPICGLKPFLAAARSLGPTRSRTSSTRRSYTGRQL